MEFREEFCVHPIATGRIPQPYISAFFPHVIYNSLTNASFPLPLHKLSESAHYSLNELIKICRVI